MAFGNEKHAFGPSETRTGAKIIAGVNLDHAVLWASPGFRSVAPMLGS